MLVSHGHSVPKLDDTREFRDFESGMVGFGVRICKTGGCRVPWKSLSGAVRSISHVACDLKCRRTAWFDLQGGLGRIHPNEGCSMYLHEVASDSYVLLQAKWAVGKARELIGHLDPTHVIVHRSEPTDSYYLYTKSEAMGRLANHDAQTTLFDAFNLHESTATPTSDAFAAADEVPDRAVVLEEGRVVGFFDATVPPTERGTKRGSDLAGLHGLRGSVGGS